MDKHTTATELVRKLTADYKLTQAEIARRTGIPQPRLSRWLHGQTPAGANDALKLLELAKTMGRRKVSVSVRMAK